MNRRDFLKSGAAAGIGLTLFWRGDTLYARHQGSRTASALSVISGALLDADDVPKYVTPLLIPPVMPKAGTIKNKRGRNVDYYEISVRQFQQQILPPGLPATTVWGYGAVAARRPNGLLLHNAPSLTIEARWNRPVRVKWINDLSDEDGNFLPHLLPVDQTLHWANPPGGAANRDQRPFFSATPEPYTGPVPVVTHVHGAVGVGDESDGYAEAWYLPVANDIPEGYATEGTWYDFFANKAEVTLGATWGPGYVTFEYPNHNRASTLWYHDHTLGMTRLNVYAGPAGFFLVRGGPADIVFDSRTGALARLPGPAPKENDKFPSTKSYYEIPIAIQDRSFNEDGSLFYPDTRTFFDEFEGPYIPDSGIAPMWNPEFFGNTLIVNGNTWPFQVVEQRRYRLRFLNGCQSRFLILDFGNMPGVEVWQIGNDGGFLAEPVPLNTTIPGFDPIGQLLIGPAERADVIVDFANVAVGNYILRNIGPDEPFGGGEAGEDFDAADPETTGQVMQFRVVQATATDPTTPPHFLRLPALTPLPAETVTRKLALLEEMAIFDDEEVVKEALLGRVHDDEHHEHDEAGGMAIPDFWMDDITENPAVGATEIWEFYNFTADAHPMHIHEIVFEIVNRQEISFAIADEDDEEHEPMPGHNGHGMGMGMVTRVQLLGEPMQAEPGESGFKDTVIAYPGQVTRVRAHFNTAGQFVWHCHIVEHEDNEMMRPYRIGPEQPGQPHGS
jgi:spore coat protein A, manganese oxidase